MGKEKVRIEYDVDKKELDDANKSLKKLDESNKDTQESASGLSDEVTSLGNRFTIAGKGAGDMASNMLSFTKATTGTTKAMRVLKVAIASTGIGLLVVGIAAFVNLLKKNQKVVDFFDKQMGRIGAIFDALSGVIGDLSLKLKPLFTDPVASIKQLGALIKENIENRFRGLINLIPSLGTAIKQLFEGDFAGAARTAGDAVALATLGVEDFTSKAAEGFESAKEAVSSFAAEMDSAVEGADKVSALLVKMREEEIRMVEATAKRRKEIQDLLIITRDLTQEFSTQQAALAKANELELANQSDLVAFAETKLDLARAELENTPVLLQTDEQRLAVAQAQADVYAEQASSAARQRELLTRVNELTTRQLASEKKVSDEKSRQVKADEDAFRTRNLMASEFVALQLERDGRLLDAERERTRAILANTELTENEREQIIQDSEDRILEIRLQAANTLASQTREISSGIFATLQAFSDLRLGQLEADQATELEMAEGNLALQDAIRERFAKKIAEERQKAAKLAKAANIIQATQNTALAVTGALGSAPFTPFNIVLASLVGALGAAQIGAIAATPIPKFAEGGIIGGQLHSNGGTLIEAEKGEHMISRRATAMYGHGIFDAINDLSFNPDSGNVTIVDTSPIAKALDDRPENHIHIDENGFHRNLVKRQYRLTQKLQRYSA